MGMGRVEMELNRAVRLRELWNRSFGLKLFVINGMEDGYALHGTKRDTSVRWLETLGRLAESLSLDLKIEQTYYIIN